MEQVPPTYEDYTAAPSGSSLLEVEDGLTMNQRRGGTRFAASPLRCIAENLTHHMALYMEYVYGDDVFEFDGHHYQVVGGNWVQETWRGAEQDAWGRCYGGAARHSHHRRRGERLLRKMTTHHGYAHGNEAWIGATDMTNEGEFAWLDGYMGSDGVLAVWRPAKGLYSNFKDGEPDENGEEDCVCFDGNGGWNDNSLQAPPVLRRVRRDYVYRVFAAAEGAAAVEVAGGYFTAHELTDHGEGTSAKSFKGEDGSLYEANSQLQKILPDGTLVTQFIESCGDGPLNFNKLARVPPRSTTSTTLFSTPAGAFFETTAWNSVHMTCAGASARNAIEFHHVSSISVGRDDNILVSPRNLDDLVPEARRSGLQWTLSSTTRLDVDGNRTLATKLDIPTPLSNVGMQNGYRFTPWSSIGGEAAGDLFNATAGRWPGPLPLTPSPSLRRANLPSRRPMFRSLGSNSSRLRLQ
ncbi:hypothetical protein JL721_12993 [Aureococcus anophagefferens]|nr:hypothetical protein JL721_12993 [Aureococcus anophagefferens]